MVKARVVLSRAEHSLARLDLAGRTYEYTRLERLRAGTELVRAGR